MRKILTFLAILLVIFCVFTTLGVFGLSWNKVEQFLFSKEAFTEIITPKSSLRIASEESVIIDAVEKVSPSVVTISLSRERPLRSPILESNPFSPFEEIAPPSDMETETIEQDIGTGFIVDSTGLVVSNKHVVSDPQADYKVITKDGKSYDVEKIYRDPSNDLAILQIHVATGSADAFVPAELGDSSLIKVGQMAIAIGTALGEFRNTVTVGVISGLGRGITAGSRFQGFSEKLDNVIQTDAAINPGNSGGPLLNSSAQVIGINTAVSYEGQNIGFAIPINIVKDSLAEFKKTGSFQRAFLGVNYRMISKDLADSQDIPEGAYVIEVVSSSPASTAGIEPDDIITAIDGKGITEENGGLAKAISSKKIGDSVSVTIWREGTTEILKAVLEENQY